MIDTTSANWIAIRRAADHDVGATPRDIVVDPNRGIAVGAVIYADTWNSIVGAAQTAARYCSCDCNYCTCDCNYCTCECNYCTCNCNHCTCNCNHRCTCNCAY